MLDYGVEQERLETISISVERFAFQFFQTSNSHFLAWESWRMEIFRNGNSFHPSKFFMLALPPGPESSFKHVHVSEPVKIFNFAEMKWKREMLVL